mmetsp:Transcript_8248/g.24624  ORF Transcript_8248/g.24624 Transcript_8248/m.24624 type:complete len:836 (+) Transcript_8248:202-2709(+)|eukprot:CAMPEP_0206149784 /NCGR_PEP_ID=MMETSP1473-20131121/37961_1 /ASSEMBLY_ACC=CAM_ASM_001109 /TAXON_ID=1461547 /ORGANISM="Stichococcus sp, Strain RCC1054" /LENGTH=835 /DNA_ID=CAMNT_0053547265 /DNA_START=96 /DNA_END=2603 /DNA_ORIENTATION=+
MFSQVRGSGLHAQAHLPQRILCSQRMLKAHVHRQLRQRSVHATSSKSEGEEVGRGDLVRVPLNLYSVLQVNQAASQDTLDNSYEALLQPPAQAEYRPAIVESRAFLLKTALDNLSDVQKRRQYDSQIATGPAQIEIDWADMPGALALMQEAGDYATVLRLSSDMLTAPPDPWAMPRSKWKHLKNSLDKTALTTVDDVSRDARLITAQAHCSAATDAAAEGDELGELQHLRDAFKDLKEARATGRLWEQVRLELEKAKPAGALLLLGQPPEKEFEDDRKYALEALKEVLGNTGESRDWSFHERDEYLQAARPTLTAEEQVKLWEHMLDAAVHRAPPGAERDSIRMPLSETEDAAIAHLVSGVRNCRPGRVTVAEKLLRQVAENAATAPAEELEAYDGEVDVTLQLAECRFLLGDPTGAFDILSHPDVNPDYLSYVQTRAAGHPELVGLCSVLRELLADVQLPDFRCCSHIEAPLSHWFGSRRVAAYLQVTDIPRFCRDVGRAAGRIIDSSDDVTTGIAAEQLDSAAYTDAQGATRPDAQQGLPEQQHRELAPDSSQPKKSAWVDRLAASRRTTGFEATSPPTCGSASAVSSQDWSDDAAEKVEAAAVIGGSSSISSGLIDQDESSATSLEEFEELDPETKAAMCFFANTRLRAGLIVGAANVLLIMVAVAAVTSRRGRPALPPSDGIATPVLAQDASKVSKVRRMVTHTGFTKSAALKLVSNWQSAKARALGPRHQLGALDGVLTGPMHRSWMGQGQALIDANTHCVFHLRDLEIKSLELGGRIDGAIITALVDETREYIDSETDKVLQKTSDQSIVKYRAVRCEGTWKLQTFEFE